MTENTTATDPRATAKAQIIDALRRRLSVQEAVEAAGISRRTAYLWRAADGTFAAAWQEAVEDAAGLISRQQVADWNGELAHAEADLAQAEAAIGDIAALAQLGDPDAVATRENLRARRQQAAEAVEALRSAIRSGEAHIARQAEAKAVADREAAAVEADDFAEQQRAAAERIDDALRTIESAWVEFDQLAKQRQSAARRAGANARPAYVRMLIAACFACAPSTATALGLDPVYRPRSRPLRDTLKFMLRGRSGGSSLPGHRRVAPAGRRVRLLSSRWARPPAPRCSLGSVSGGGQLSTRTSRRFRAADGAAASVPGWAPARHLSSATAMTTTTGTDRMRALFVRLADLGYAEPWVREHVLPDWWDDRAAYSAVGFTEALWTIAQRLGIDAAALR